MFSGGRGTNSSTIFFIFCFFVFLSHPKVSERVILGQNWLILANFDPKWPYRKLPSTIKRRKSKKTKKWQTNLFPYPQGIYIPICRPIGPFSQEEQRFPFKKNAKNGCEKNVKNMFFRPKIYDFFPKICKNLQITNICLIALCGKILGHMGNFLAFFGKNTIFGSFFSTFS